MDAGESPEAPVIPSAGTVTELALACDEVVRLGSVFRCQVSKAVAQADFDRGPYVLQLTLSQAGQPLVSSDFPLAKLGQLRDGVQLNVVPGGIPPSGQPVDLSLTLTNPMRSDLQRVTRRLATPLGLQQALTADFARLVAADPQVHDPLPYLWAEQAGEATTTGASLQACALLAQYEQRLSGWLRGQRPGIFPIGCSERALRDPVDGSIQPWRVHMPRPTRQPTPLVVLFSPADQDLRKSTWPMLASPWLAAARDAGVAILEIYAAGDRTWCGVGVARAELAIRACASVCPGVATGHLILVGVGTGAPGAIALAERDPERATSLVLVDPALALTSDGDAPPDDAHGFGRWLALAAPGGRPAHLTGLPTLVSGVPDAACAAWLERLSRCGAEVLRQYPSPATPAFWEGIAERPPSQPPREYVVLAPGRYGPVQVEALVAWGSPGSLRIESRMPERVATLGISALIPDGPAMVNGQPWHAAVPPSLPAKVLGQACGPLAAYANRAFVVVVGTIENIAAAQDNRQLAKAFVAAWAAYAQGRPRLVDDHDFHDQDVPGANLVLIGNRRSNAVLARLLADDHDFPLSWDSRSVIYPGGSQLRDQHRAVAVAWPHPAHDGRLLVVLDGALPASKRAGACGMPLAGLGDLVVGGDSPGTPPVVERLFSQAWK
jgi:hypothetical protein